VRVAFTGGGTAGHVTPNLALIERLLDDDVDCFYLGSSVGIESRLLEGKSVTFCGIASGKLRRYFSWENFIDPFKVIWGFFQALGYLHRIQPQVLFSKGGFVAVPVVFAASLLRIPVIIHESDLTPGLANRLSAPLSACVCLNFGASIQYFPSRKCEVTGTPLREGLLRADAARGRAWLQASRNVDPESPILLVSGGSMGSQSLNDLVRKDLASLCKQFFVVHLVGRGGIDASRTEDKNYLQCEFLDQEFGDVLAAADLVVSRAGANALYEHVSFNKPQVLVPLPATASRGDQLENAAFFEQEGYAMVALQDRLRPGDLAAMVERAWSARESMINATGHFNNSDSVQLIIDLIQFHAKDH
jgi:UDP-N-acetylglucosamine--N-acetylmuramyl-(pentapeptide) pyrophosphoryl-undecaprenol N-acetylglucosamine transferase